MSFRRIASASAALVMAGLGVGLASVGPAYAADPPACDSSTSDETTAPGPLKTNVTAKALDIDGFQRAVIAEGAARVGDGVTVAVVSSGIDTDSGLRLVPGSTFRVEHAAMPVTQTQGTTLGGIIAGQKTSYGTIVGIAPGTQLIDVHVYDNPPGTDTSDSSDSPDSSVTLSPSTLLAGLDHLAAMNLRQAGVKIVLVGVAVAVTPDDALQTAIRKITDQGVIVVAPSGDRSDVTGSSDGSSSSSGDTPSDGATPDRGEDYASRLAPARYSLDKATKGLVLAVATTVPDGTSPSDIEVYNSAIDLAAPSLYAGSVTVDGLACQVGAPSTHIAAAEVAGVLAGLLSVPGTSATKAIQELEATAAGVPFEAGMPTDRLVGQGVIQPYEAVTRPLAFDKQGNLIRAKTPAADTTPVALPAKEPDVLRSTRHHALWWGLGGGVALLVAVLLRPVLARRRT